MKSLTKKLLASAIAIAISGSNSALAQSPDIDEKTKRYHDILLKRPSSTPVFQRFQSSFLSKNNEADLLLFLENNAKSDSAADSQLLASYLLQKGMTKEALIAFDRAIKITPNNAGVHLTRAQCYAKIFNFDKAILRVW